MKGVLQPLPGCLKLKCREWKQPGGLLSSLYAKYHLCSSSPCQFSPHRAERGDPNVSVSLTVVGLRRGLTCRLTGYHGVGHGCGPRSNLPSRPPASFKGPMGRASTVYEKKQNQNIIDLKLDLCRLKNRRTWACGRHTDPHKVSLKLNKCFIYSY